MTDKWAIALAFAAFTVGIYLALTMQTPLTANPVR